MRKTVFAFVVRTVLKFFYRRWEVVGLENVPENGPCLVVSNHNNALVDPIVVGAVLPRKIRYLAKASLWKKPVVSTLLDLTEGIPVVRPQDLKASIELLASTSPERIFLTHYSELAYSEQLKESLLEQIDNYVRMAVQYDGHAGQLEEAIMDDSLERVAAMNNLEEVSERRELFRHDAQLNAQGLAIWYQRQQS